MVMFLSVGCDTLGVCGVVMSDAPYFVFTLEFSSILIIFDCDRLLCGVSTVSHFWQFPTSFFCKMSVCYVCYFEFSNAPSN